MIIAVLPVETQRMETFKLFLLEQQWLLLEKNNLGLTKVKLLPGEFLNVFTISPLA